MSLPVAQLKNCTYENVVADCPECGSECIFNRRSDLEILEPIGGLDVECVVEGCKAKFRIIGDSVNERHEMLIFDVYQLLERKQYMACVLNLAQAYEMFFSLYLRVELLYRPFGMSKSFDMDYLNRLSGELTTKVKDHPFAKMRRHFLTLVLDPGSHPTTLEKAEEMIAALPDQPCEPRDAAIREYPKERVASLLLRVKKTPVCTLRNSVVHKRGYRPNREEVMSSLQEARETLFPLTSRLDLHDDLNWYTLRGA